MRFNVFGFCAFHCHTAIRCDNNPSPDRHKQRHARDARRAMSGIMSRFGDYAIFCQLHLFWLGHTFRFRLCKTRLARCSCIPVVARSHLSRRITGLPRLPGMGRRWYCHMADTGSGLRRPASKTAIAHPHKSTTDSARVSLPPNYLIDVTRAVGRVTSFSFFLFFLFR